MFRQGFTCPALLFVTPQHHLSNTGLSPSTARLSRLFLQDPLIDGNWAGPLSLAATKGISVDFFSSGYLDVSVPRVRLLHLCIQCKIPHRGGFPHSEILGSKLTCQLPEAYRRLQRPSSPLTAQASTVCTYSLDHITPNILESHFKQSDITINNKSLTNICLIRRLLKLCIQIFKEQNSAFNCKVIRSLNEKSDHLTILTQVWWSQAGSNRRPPACKAGALPAELWPL